MKRIEKYLPEKPKALVNFQAKIDAELFEKVQAKKKLKKLKWEELTEALFRAYLDEK